jgi:hypothetical protein
VNTPPEKRDEAIFEIVNQLNRCAALNRSHDERERLAELNLAAGRRAKTSSAYASALTYFTAGRGTVAGGRLGPRARAAFRIGSAPSRMRVLDWRARRR